MISLQEAAKLLAHVPSVMLVLLVAGLIMGLRHVGEYSVFDLLTGITIGAVAGAGIVEPDLPQLPVLLTILAMAALHWAVTFLVTKIPFLGRITTFEPIVVVQDGRPLKKAMQRVRLTLADLLPLLRQEGIFDLRDVRYALLEPDGKVSVLKRDDQVKALPRPVVVDGHPEPATLRDLGWNDQRLRHALAQKGYHSLAEILLAMLDEDGKLDVFPLEGNAAGPTINH